MALQICSMHCFGEGFKVLSATNPPLVQPKIKFGRSKESEGRTMRVRTVRMISVLILVAGSSALAPAQTKTVEKDAPVAALAPPETPVRDVKETFFGTEINDPYRWLEDLKSPEVSSWMHAQNDYTRAVLERIPNRDKLLTRIAQLDDAGVRVISLQSFGGRLFYLKQSAGEDHGRLYVGGG